MHKAQVELLRDESKRDRRGNRIYTEERKREFVAEWRASGLTQRVFAQKVGVKYGTLISWTCKRCVVGKAQESGSVAFRELTMAPVTKGAETTLVEVVLPDGIVLRGGTAVELANLVRELRRA